jgi:hypothetical protein
VVNGPSDADAARLRLFDAVARLLERLARQAPTLVVLDDLHWADESSLQLLRFVAAPYRPVPLVIVGAYRHDELGAGAARTLAELAAHGELVQLHGLSQQEVFELIVDAVDVLAADRWAVEVHRRTEGHPSSPASSSRYSPIRPSRQARFRPRPTTWWPGGWNGSRRTAGHSSRPPWWPATNCCPTCSARCAASSLRPWRCSSRRA